MLRAKLLFPPEIILPIDIPVCTGIPDNQFVAYPGPHVGKKGPIPVGFNWSINNICYPDCLCQVNEILKFDKQNKTICIDIV